MITVFTSSYNYSRYLRLSIESVLNQSYTDFEYHLIDYGSTDDTWTIMQEYERKDSRIKAFQIGAQENKVRAMNFSIEQARGDYWCWSPADDFLHKDLLLHKVKLSQQYPEAVIYSDFYHVDDNNNVIGDITLNLTDEDIRTKIWKHGIIGFTGIFIPVSLLRKIPFDEKEMISEDYRWMIQAVKAGVKFIGIAEKLFYKRKYSGSITGRRYSEVIKNMYKIQDDLR